MLRAFIVNRSAYAPLLRGRFKNAVRIATVPSQRRSRRFLKRPLSLTASPQLSTTEPPNSIGVGGPGFRAGPPPSEPDGRISRIRLSSQWARLRDWLADALAVVNVNNPSFAKYSLVQS
jgi:hypothetical protein